MSEVRRNGGPAEERFRNLVDSMGLFHKPGRKVPEKTVPREPTLPMPESAKRAEPARPYVLHWLPPGMAAMASWAAQQANQAQAVDLAPKPQEPGGREPAKEPPAKRAGLLARLPVGWRIITRLALIGVPAGVAAFGGLLLYYTLTLPHPLTLRNKERSPVVRVLARDGTVMAERGAAHDFVPIDFVPPHVRNAVVATEDRRFYEHYGIDPWGLIRAGFANLRAGRVAQGGSTLTQQLAKNLFLSSERTLARKIEEVALAVWLELRLSKLDILELYLNQVYFGGGAYGIEAAAQRYFDKSVRALTLGEAAIIAGLLKAPSKYSPSSNPGAARARGRVVLARMRAAGIISAEEERRAERQRVRFAEAKRQRDMPGTEYAVEFVLERLPRLVGSGHAEVIVETTFDAALQRKAQAVVEAQLAKAGATQGASQAALVLLDLDGAIVAMVGGRRHAESEFNRAVKARRQPGSAFKPFVYLAALEKGATPETVVYDLPLSVDGWTPRNDSGQYQGAVTMRRALTQSINTVAVRLHLDVGADRVAATARRLGILSELRAEPSLALGTSELTLLELTGAYDIFASGGSSVEPHGIRRVRLSSGRVLYARAAPQVEQLILPRLNGELSDMLHAAATEGTGRRAAIAGHAIAGKTGTTQDFRDAWFVGFTGHFTAGVWVGNDNGKAMNHVTGGGLPASIWHEVMATAHDGRPPLTLPSGGGVDRSVAPAAIAETAMPRRELLPWENNKVGVPLRGEKRADAQRLRQRVAKVRGEAKGHSKPAPAAQLPSQVKVSASRPRAEPRHPTERIGEDFLDRVLADQAQGESRVAGEGQDGEDRATAARLRPAPEGLMSLGGRSN